MSRGDAPFCGGPWATGLRQTGPKLADLYCPKCNAEVGYVYPSAASGEVIHFYGVDNPSPKDPGRQRYGFSTPSFVRLTNEDLVARTRCRRGHRVGLSFDQIRAQLAKRRASTLKANAKR
jgi:hypothetical protein